MFLKERLRDAVFSSLWNSYRNAVPDVIAIEDVLRAQGEVWNEDHVAFRTLPGEACGSHVLQELFELMGYTRMDNYAFPDKKLAAFWMRPPVEKMTPVHSASPKVFISELIATEFDEEFQHTLKKYTQTVQKNPLPRLKKLLSEAEASNDESRTPLLADQIVAFLSGPSWQRPSTSDYEILRSKSEYAAWTLAFGNTANHFTVSIHCMKNFPTLRSFNEFLIEKLKVSMNESGGIIKGSRELRLEQSATLAATREVMFQDGLQVLPYAFVEFAHRHALEENANSNLWNAFYQGFVVNNADKIFESTNIRP